MSQILDLNINLASGSKIYFLSDIHLGTPNDEVSLVREKKIIRFLDSVQADAHAIFFVGDIFDFWFEYQEVVPKYFVRFLSKIIELQERGIAVYFLKGNHDLWMNNYISDYLGVHLVADRIFLNANETKIFISHGDGKGPNDTKYKILKKIFTNPVCRWLFRWLHPDIGIKVAQIWSRSSFTNPADEKFLGEDKEWLIQYAKKKIKETDFNYFVFGHRHLPMIHKLDDNKTYVNLGDWLYNDTYAVFDGDKLELKKWEEYN